MSAIGERDLILRSKQGDGEAFSELNRRYRRRIFSICYGIVHDVEQAEDLVQETFIRAFRHLDRFKMESGFYTWIYRIAVNACINFIRKRQISPREVALTEFSYLGEAAKAFVKGKRTAEEELEIKEVHDLMEKGLKQLSVKHRQVLEMFDMEGLSHKVIAERLNCKVSTVRSRLHYARKAMRAYLKGFK